MRLATLTKLAVLVFPLVLGVACASSNKNAQSPKQKAGNAELCTKKTTEIVKLFQNKKFDEIFGLFDSNLQKKLSSATLRTIYLDIDKKYGELQAVVGTSLKRDGDQHTYIATARFANGYNDFSVTYNSDYEVTGIWVKPSSYEDQNTKNLKAQALQYLQMIVDKKFETFFGHCNTEMQKALKNAAVLQKVWSSQNKEYGTFVSLTADSAQPRGPKTVVITATGLFENKKVLFTITVTKDSTITGFHFKDVARYIDPSYADQSLFTEQKVTVGADGWPLKGMLTIPKGAAPFPALVLVHGSGPSDLDGSWGPFKTFKDLAWGLSSRGIAVLRFEKRTFAHVQKITKIPDYSPQHEYIDDVVAAVHYLSSQKAIQSDKIYVLGHSQGGLYIPRIAKTCLKAAGFVSFAAPLTDFGQTYIRQVKYLTEFDGKVTEQEQQLIKKYTQQVKQYEQLRTTLSAGKTYTGGKVFGAPASYWDYYFKYDPIAEGKTISKPWLFLQGERDYQVEMAEFAQWKKALSDKGNVKFKSYAKLNHAFAKGAGTGPSSSDEYEKYGGNVDLPVIEDIAQFLMAGD